MPESIENYISQPVAVKMRHRAFLVWSIFTVLVAAWTFLIVIAPVAEAYNFTSVSHPIYKVCSFICHQIPERSMHIYEHAFAVCSRCFGIYFGLFFGFLIYPFVRPIEEIEPLPRFWLFLALIPMGIDFSLGFFGIWENTHLSRFTTGLILGATCAVFIVPALVELFQFLANKRQVKRLSR